ncbi:MAG: hypothetical protein B6D61_12015, partial [Bacteroidetes bacterium 4484_249]
MNFAQLITGWTAEAIKVLYDQSIEPKSVQIEKTNPEFKGDFTLVVFPLLKLSKKSPQITAVEIGDYFIDNFTEIDSVEVV